jgi:subtilisin family serine protease
MNLLDMVTLTRLMQRCNGAPEVVVALIDGPVMSDHADLAGQNIRLLRHAGREGCGLAKSAACRHGTFVAGMLVGRRGSAALAISPGCTLLSCPIFGESGPNEPASATPEALAQAIVECVDAGARLVNLSLALSPSSLNAQRRLHDALDHAANRGALVIAAAGNQGMVGSSVLTGHNWVIPVAACNASGRPTDDTNLGHSIARRGLRAPGEGVPGLGTDGSPRRVSGTSLAAPFVAGAAALLWSLFPAASAAQIRHALLDADRVRPRCLVPPLLDAWAAFEALERRLAIPQAA